MRQNLKPLISSTVPSIGDGSIEKSVLDKIIPLLNNALGNIVKELSVMHARISALEQIGPSVRINFNPTGLWEFEQAIKKISPPLIDDFAEEKVATPEEKKDETINPDTRDR